MKNIQMNVPPKALVLCVAAALTSMTASSFAQDANQSTGSKVVASSQVEEIVVTAQKRKENLQRVPISVTAVTAAAAEAGGISGMQDISLVTPGLHFTQAVGNATPFVRGIGTQAVGAGQEPSVATYIDGVYLAAMPGAMFSFNNIERIEVLKGPQGTLFGRNATGGLIQIITKDPSATPEAKIRFGFGNFNKWETNFYAGGGLSDTVAADIALYSTEQGKGWGKNLATGKDVNKTRETSVRSKWVVKPSTDTKVTLIADYGKSNSSEGVAVRPIYESKPALGAYYTGGFWDVNSNFDPKRTMEQSGVSAKIEHDFDTTKFVSITSYRDVRASQGFDQDVTPTPGVVVTLNSHETAITQELQLQSKGDGPFNWIFGGFFFDSDAKNQPVDIKIYPAVTHAPGLVNIEAFGYQKTQSLAAFAQGTWALSTDTNVTAGLRYTKDTRKAGGYDLVHLTFIPADQLHPYAEQKSSVGKPTWRLAIDHQLSKEAMVYASYNRGFKSGTYNLEHLTDPALRPEKLDALEVGSKLDLLDRRLRINSSVFYYDYSDIQLTRTEAGVQKLLNAGSGKSYGLDVELTAKVTPKWTVRSSVELLNAHYTSFPSASLVTPNATGGNTITSFDAKGKQMIRTPSSTFELSSDYVVDLDSGATLKYSGTYYHNSGWYPEADNRIKQAAYNLLSGQVAWVSPTGQYSVRLWGRNLTNAKVYAQLSEQALNDGGSVTAPRTFGVSLDIDF